MGKRCSRQITDLVAVLLSPTAPQEAKSSALLRLREAYGIAPQEPRPLAAINRLQTFELIRRLAGCAARSAASKQPPKLAASQG